MAEKENSKRQNTIMAVIVDFLIHGGYVDMSLVFGTICTIIYTGYQIFGALDEIKDLRKTTEALKVEVSALSKVTSNLDGKLEIIKVILPNEPQVKKP